MKSRSDPKMQRLGSSSVAMVDAMADAMVDDAMVD